MKKMRTVTKIVLSVVALAIIGVGIYVAQYLIRFTFYRQYKEYAQDYSKYEQGKEFVALSGGSAELAEFSLAAENDKFRLYINTETCNVALEDLASGKIYYTNPYPLGDKSAVHAQTDLQYERLQSQLVVTYYLESKPNLLSTFASYTDCVGIELNSGEEKHYTIESLENGIRVTYQLGSTATETGMVPKYLTQERYNEIYAQLDAIGRTERKAFAGKYSESKDYPGFLELGEGNINPFTLAKMEEALSKIGYTMEDYYADMEAAGAEVVEPLLITVPLEYRLTDDGMETSIPTEYIKESGGAMTYEVSVLPYFGAIHGEEGGDGYFFVPSGSGALIRFNNGKMDSNITYSEYIYGEDLLAVEETVLDIAEDVKLPVFGIQSKDATLLITVDDAESLAKVNAVTSKVFNIYNYAYASYILRETELVNVEGQVDPMPVIEKNIYSAYLTQSYHILPEEEEYDGYSGMAKYYRQMLFGNDEASDSSVITDEAEDIKMYLDILGAVERESSMLGFKYNEVLAMTTFEEAKEILDVLYANDIRNTIVNYQGWMNKGYFHDTVDNIKVIRKLGGKKGFEELKSYIEEKGGKLYGDVALQYVSFAAGDYNYTAQSSRYYGQGYAASFGKVGPTTYSRSASLGYLENLYDLLSPKFLPKYVNYLIEETEKLDMTGYSLRDLGSVLYSDKKRKELIDREYSEHIMLAMFDKLDATGKQMLLNNPLAFALPYADDVTNVSFYKNSYVYLDEEVPFYEMVMHGYVDYSGKAYNLNANITKVEECLEMIEAGACPHFTFAYEDSSELKYTALNNYYSTQFDSWKDEAMAMYKQVNAVLRNVANSTMERHECTDNVVTVTYSNGVVITIDKEASVVTVEGADGTQTYEFK